MGVYTCMHVSFNNIFNLHMIDVAIKYFAGVQALRTWIFTVAPISKYTHLFVYSAMS